MDYQKYIARDPKICGGEPVIKGTRVTVRIILGESGRRSKHSRNY